MKKNTLNLIRAIYSSEKIFLIISQVGSTLIMLIIGKVIAENFTPSEFGVYTLQYAVYMFLFSSLLSPVVQFSKTYNNNLSQKIGYLGYVPIFLFLALLLVFLFFLYLKFLSGTHSIPIILIVSSYCLLETLVKVGLDKLNTEGRMKMFAFFSVFHKAVMLCFLFLVITSFQPLTSDLIWLYMVLAYIPTALLLCYFADFKLISRYRVSIMRLFKRVVQYAIPLSLMSVFSWLNSYFDRLAIEYFINVEQLGIYSAAYGLGSKFALTIIPLFLSLITPIVYGRFSIQVKRDIVNKYVKVFSVLSLTVVLAVGLCYPIIGRVLLSDLYREGFYIIAGINLAYFILTFGYLYEAVLYSESRNKEIFTINLLSSLINVVLNIYLIALIGVAGAVVATLVSFLSRSLMVLRVYNRL